jgi:hypothetical protein
MTTKTKKTHAPAAIGTTSGGPFNVEPAAADLFTAHLEVVCSAEGSKEERGARKRRAQLLAGLSMVQRNLAGELARGIGRLCGR